MLMNRCRRVRSVSPAGRVCHWVVNSGSMADEEYKFRVLPNLNNAIDRREWTLIRASIGPCVRNEKPTPNECRELHQLLGVPIGSELRLVDTHGSIIDRQTRQQHVSRGITVDLSRKMIHGVNIVLKSNSQTMYLNIALDRVVIVPNNTIVQGRFVVERYFNTGHLFPVFVYHAGTNQNYDRGPHRVVGCIGSAKFTDAEFVILYRMDSMPQNQILFPIVCPDVLYRGKRGRVLRCKEDGLGPPPVGHTQRGFDDPSIQCEIDDDIQEATGCSGEEEQTVTPGTSGTEGSSLSHSRRSLLEPTSTRNTSAHESESRRLTDRTTRDDDVSDDDSENSATRKRRRTTTEESNGSSCSSSSGESNGLQHNAPTVPTVLTTRNVDVPLQQTQRPRSQSERGVQYGPLPGGSNTMRRSAGGGYTGSPELAYKRAPPAPGVKSVPKDPIYRFTSKRHSAECVLSAISSLPCYPIQRESNSGRVKRLKLFGNIFDSRLEARWAVYMHALGVRFGPEHITFNIPGTGGDAYTPDFFLPEQQLFVEIKPHMPDLEAMSKAQQTAEYLSIGFVLLYGDLGAPFSLPDRSTEPFRFSPHPYRGIMWDTRGRRVPGDALWVMREEGARLDAVEDPTVDLAWADWRSLASYKVAAHVVP